MKKNNKKIILSIAIVLVIVLISVGATYAFYRASTNNTTGINGHSYDFSVGFNITVIRSGNLVPTADNLISQSISSQNVCQDRRGYSLCSMYKLTLVNTGMAQALNGYIKTLNTTTYTTDNLKYQMYTKSGNTYTAITSAQALSHTTNSTNYFKLNNNNVTFNIADGSTASQTKEYYLVIWLSDTGSNQLEDANKKFAGDVIFQNTAGNNITSTFTA